MHRQFPEIHVCCAAVDSIRQKGYVLPGLGDAGTGFSERNVPAILRLSRPGDHRAPDSSGRSLSIDNALVLGILAGPVRRRDRLRVLWYGLLGAFALRVAAVSAGGFSASLVHPQNPRRNLPDLRGGIPPLPPPRSCRRYVESCPPSSGFWRNVAGIEITDFAFAVDLILAAVGLVGGCAGRKRIHPELWVFVTGGSAGPDPGAIHSGTVHAAAGAIPALDAGVYCGVRIGFRL